MQDYVEIILICYTLKFDCVVNDISYIVYSGSSLYQQLVEIDSFNEFVDVES